MSMEEDFDRPYVSDLVQKIIDEQLQRDDRNFGDEVLEGAYQGIAMPWLGSFGLGAYLGVKCSDNEDVMGNISKGFKGGVIATICLSPISLILSLPLALASMGFSTFKYVKDGIKASMHEEDFDKEMAHHLLRWVELVKRGRLSIREELKRIEQELKENKQAFSLRDEALYFLNPQKFDFYFHDTRWTRLQLEELVHGLSEAQNTWGEFFHALSSQIKISELTDKQWLKLQNKLKDHIDSSSDNCMLKKEDVDEYIYFSIYYFVIANKGNLKLLKHYISIDS